MNEKDWDGVAITFEEEIFNVPANDRKGLIRSRLERFAGPARTAADLGCGVGRTLSLLAGCFGRVYAVDISSECLAMAEEANSGSKNVRYVHADLSAPRKGYPSVDMVLCINTWLNGDLGIRLGIIDHTCRAVKRGGHLLLVVPALGSALLTTFRRVQWELREGTPAAHVPSVVDGPQEGVEHGIIHIDQVPTKHYLKEELEVLLAERGLRVAEMHKLEYPWSTEFEEPPRWMRAPYPWDWFVVAERVR
ncbi:MAG: methyltransferase domain-containing protein [Flavobacteriales bacterium]|nr:methyltransferase domain-containing protein [Flavobacteriales bacterium]MCB9167042.1 methyltransferase domain-containing protein [Flavobacteriales bacterium]